MRCATQGLLTNGAFQGFRLEFVRNLPPPLPSINNLWYALGVGTSNQLALLSADPAQQVCNLFPTSSFAFTQLQFRDIVSNGNTTFIVTSGSPGIIYGVGSNTSRIFGPAIPTSLTVLSAIEAGNFLKVRASSNTLWALSANGALFYRGQDEPNISYTNQLTLLPGRFNDFEATNRGIIALSGTDVYVKGSNINGELGMGILGVSRTAEITNLTLLTGRWMDIRTTTTGNRSYLLSANNNINQWFAAGSNAFREIGQGGILTEPGTDNVTQFVPISGNWTDISLGSFHTFALSGNSLFAAGSNSHGQLGLGVTAGTSPRSFTQVTGSWSKLPREQGALHSLALSNDLLYGCGAGDQRIGNCTGTPSNLTTTFNIISSNTFWTDAFCVGNISFALSARPQDRTAGSGPSAPLNVVITPGVRQINISFEEPAFTGFSVIRNYQYTVNGGLTWITRTPASTASPLVITGLGNGVLYEVALRALNNEGFGSPSPLTPITTFSLPSPPTLTSVVNGDSILSVFWNPPISDGGSPIISYDYSIDNGVNWTLAAGEPDIPIPSPYIITDLQNGIERQVRFRALNAVGNSAASNMIPRTPSVLPQAPTIVSSNLNTSGLLAAINVSFNTPSFDGGAPIINYQYSVNNGTTWVPFSPAATTSPLVIPNLAYDAIYNVRIRAVNINGSGPASNLDVVTIPRQTGSQIYTGVGAYKFTVPGGVTTMNIEAIGGGGGGAAGQGRCGSGGSGSTSQVTRGTPGVTLVFGGGGGGGGCVFVGGNGGFGGDFHNSGLNGNGTGGRGLSIGGNYGAGSGSCVALCCPNGGGGGYGRGSAVPVTPGQILDITVGGGGGGGCGRNRQGGFGCCATGAAGVVYLSW